MQNIKLYVSAAQTLGIVRDYANAKNATAPTLVRGCEVCLKMRVFANAEGDTPYPKTQLDKVVAWQWAMDNDFNDKTAYKLEADNANITVEEVTESSEDDTEIQYTEFSIPITNMNTEELAEWLGTNKSQTGLHGELVGFDGDGKQIFVLQVENFTIRNRITSLGDPTPIDPEYLTASQVRALIAAGRYLPVDAAGPFEEREQYNDENQGFVFFATDRGEYFFKTEDGWSDGFPLRGEDGRDGVDGTVSFEELTEDQRAQLKGDPGKDGAAGKDGLSAGFGKPTISVETVEPDVPASATVSASGVDTMKVFSFKFQIPKGKPGKNGSKGDRGDDGLPAGFGAPEATVTTLDSGQDATVEIETDGPDTEKVFKFKFGIPRGANGLPGADGQPGRDGKDCTCNTEGGGVAAKPDKLVLICPTGDNSMFPVVEVYSDKQLSSGTKICDKNDISKVQYWDGSRWNKLTVNGIPNVCANLPVEIDISSVSQKSGYFKYSWVDTKEAVSDTLSLPFPAIAEPIPYQSGASPEQLIADMMSGEQSLTENGYQKLPGGLILQWGITDVSTGESVQTAKFPIPFTTKCFQVIGSTYLSDPTYQINAFVQIKSFSKESFEWFPQCVSDVRNLQCSFFAIGI